MTNPCVTHDIIGEASAYVKEVTRLHTITRKIGTLIEWRTTIISGIDIVGSINEDFRYWLPMPRLRTPTIEWFMTMAARNDIEGPVNESFRY